MQFTAITKLYRKQNEKLHVTDDLRQLFALQYSFSIPANVLLMQAVCGCCSLGLLIEF